LNESDLQTKFDFLLSAKDSIVGFENIKSFQSFSHIEIKQLLLFEKINIPFPFLKTKEEIWLHKNDQQK